MMPHRWPPSIRPCKLSQLSRKLISSEQVETFRLMTRWLDFNTTEEVNLGSERPPYSATVQGWTTCCLGITTPSGSSVPQKASFVSAPVARCGVSACLDALQVRYGHHTKGWITKKEKARRCFSQLQAAL